MAQGAAALDRASITARRLWLLAILAWIGVGLWVFRGVPAILDEGVHAAQVMLLLGGSAQQHPLLTTFPTYHMLLAAMVWPLSGSGELPDHDLLRLLSSLLALTVLPIAYRLVRATGGSPLEAARRTYAFALLPGIAPLAFVLYTDVVALVPVLLAALCLAVDRPRAAVASAVLATLLRQTHVVWALWIAFQRWRELRAASPHVRLRGLLPALLPLALFAGFVLVNGGVALGDRDLHPSTVVSLDNLHFGLLFAWLVLLPLQAGAAARISVALRSQPLAALPGLLLILAFMLWFAPDHPYNRVAPEGILHNGMIELLRQPLPRCAAALAILWSLWTLQFTALRIDGSGWLRLFMVLSLLPMWMVDPRYALPALALFFLLREPDSGRIERLQAGWSTLLGAGATAGYATYTFVL